MNFVNIQSFKSGIDYWIGVEGDHLLTTNPLTIIIKEDSIEFVEYNTKIDISEIPRELKTSVTTTPNKDEHHIFTVGKLENGNLWIGGWDLGDTSVKDLPDSDMELVLSILLVSFDNNSIAKTVFQIQQDVGNFTKIFYGSKNNNATFITTDFMVKDTTEPN